MEDISIGFEIEPSRSLRFKKNKINDYASLVTNFKLENIKKKLNIFDEEVDISLAYLIIKGKKVLGLYLDTAPELEFFDDDFPRIGIVDIFEGLEIKSVNEGILNLNSNELLVLASNLYIYTQIFNARINTVRKGTPEIVISDNESWIFTDLFFEVGHSTVPFFVSLSKYKFDITFGAPYALQKNKSLLESFLEYYRKRQR